MTTDKIWVRKSARWLARFKTTEGQLRSISLGIAAFSTFSLVLQNAGMGRLVPYVGILAVGIWIVYTYYYSERGVHNQVQRDNLDLSDNYSGPSMFMDNMMILVAIYIVLEKEKPSKEELRDMESAMKEVWERYREGIELE